MTTTATLTLDDFLKLPETEPASEFACGRVAQKPMPGLTHSIVQGLVVAMLRQFLRRTRLGLAGTELRCIFGAPGEERAFVPDVVFISSARLPRGDFRDTLQFRMAPDLAVEVLSPGQHVGRFTQKVQLYLRHGVRLVWVIDPVAETETIHSPSKYPVTLSAGDELAGEEVLPGFALAVAGILAELSFAVSFDDGDVASTNEIS